MTISQVARDHDMTTDTIRYYERIGLIPRVNRTASGIRDFTETDIKWVNFAKCMRGAGLPIEALVEYIELFHRGDSTLTARKELLIEQRNILHAKAEQMLSTVQRLDEKIARYEDTIQRAERELTK